MKRAFLFLLAFLMAAAPAGLAVETGGVVVVPVKGEISEAQFFFIRRVLKNAENNHAAALVLDMDTFGGDAKAAMKIMDALMKSDLPTFTLVNGKAISAGALIAIATRKIYMTPAAVIGAAAPVMGGGEDLPSTMNDKTVSAISAVARAACQKNGYNADIADAFIDKEKEVKIGDAVIHAKGSVLTLSAQEAVRLFNDKPLLAAGIVASVDELLGREKITSPARLIDPTGFEKIAFWVTALAPIFLMIGIVGAYLEFKLQGTLVPGIVAAFAFLIFFTGHYIAGLSGWEVSVVFAIGLMLVISELALHPGTIIPGVTGMMLMLGALFWAMVDRYPGEPLIPTAGMLRIPIQNLGIAVVIGVALIVILARYLPRTSLYHRFVLGAANPGGPSFSTTGTGSPARLQVGATGVARSILRPSGNAEFNGLHIDVITQGEFIEPGTPIRVLAVEGARIVVVKIGSEL